MSILLVCVAAAAVFLVAYWVYGNLLARLLQLSDDRKTPAHELRDDVDYVPTPPRFLMSQHFSAIAAAGPIVGPILAGLAFGWGPALLWIVLGSIFVGGVHDFTVLVASIRHKATTIAEIVRLHMTRRSYLLFLAFIWIALVYIIVAFTDIVARSFVGVQNLTIDDTVIGDAGGAAASSTHVVSGGAIASSSLLYLALPLLMGLLLRYTKLSLNWATAIFLPLVVGAIAVGPYIPFDLAAWMPGADEAARMANAVKAWDVLLLAYCLVAGALPVWMLLQPRGHLGGYFLYVALIGGVGGIIVQAIGGLLGWVPNPPRIHYDAFVTWNAADGPLLPMLVITIACGACSGFHCLIASGTTSKQLRRESDAKPIGYGTMLLEGMVAVLSLSCVMILTTEGAAAVKGAVSLIYAQGLAKYLSVFAIPVGFAVSFGLLAFTTFVYDTLDVCTRLGRFAVQEVTGWWGRGGRWFGTALTAGVPLLFVTQSMTAGGKPVPAWRVFWPLFGASNQLLAALALIGVTVWLWRTYRTWWVWPVVALPAAWMYVMSIWALVLFIRAGFWTPDGAVAALPSSPIPYAAVVLVLLAAVLLVEAVAAVRRTAAAPTGTQPRPV